MLSDAMLLYEQGRPESAADRAYYAMFHAAHAALAFVGRKGPRSHRGVRSEFGEHVVKAGLIEIEYARDLTKAHMVRQEGTYEAYAGMAKDEVASLVERARRFIERVRTLMTEGTP